MGYVEAIRNERIISHSDAANEWLEQIPQFSMVKSRCAIEAILDAYTHRYGYEVDKSHPCIADFLVMIKKNPNIADIPSTVLARIESVQKFGNLAAHKDMIDADKNDARLAVELMMSVKKWYNQLPPTMEKPSKHNEEERKMHMEAGFRLKNMGMLDKAASAFQEAANASEDPDSRKAVIARMRSLESLLDLNGGVATLSAIEAEAENAVRIGGVAGFHLMKLHAHALREKGERRKAKLIMKQAVKWLEDEKRMERWVYEACNGLRSLIKLHILDGDSNTAKNYLKKIETLVGMYESAHANFELAAARILMNAGPEESKLVDEDLKTLEMMKTYAQSMDSPYEWAVCLEWEYLLNISRDGVTAESIEKGRKAYEKFETLGLKSDVAFGFNNLAFDWIELEEFEKARKLLEKAEKMSDDYCFMNLKPFIELNLGKIAARTDELELAENHFDNAVKMVSVYCGNEDLLRFKGDREKELSIE
jgi:tetratricopeptide (TPR) repeat protein